MHFLISNDDGYRAPGLKHLVEALRDLGEVTVVAPDRNRSGASNSLTLDLPLRVSEMENGFMAVDGTPTDCVHLAITGLLHQPPDMVFSGINNGENMGDDVLYSGTVAAATEGRFLGYPAIAISLAGEDCQHYSTAARVACLLVEKIKREPLPRDTILNVNVPDVAWQDLRGFRSTRLGQRHKSEPVISEKDPRGRQIYWVGPAGCEQDAGPGTDFNAVRNGYVSVTPLQIDLTLHALLDTVSEWLNELGEIQH